jgi:hypothetical protein
LTKKDYIIPSLGLFCVIGLVINGPIPQQQSYHNFADQREILGIPNFLNVITNLPFAIIGLLGFRAVRNINEKKLKYISDAIFAGFLMVALGSGYYHLWPGNDTLVYDRMPIAIIIMSFFALIIYDCINPRKGYNALIILNIVGIISVVYWAFSERMGNGDLRWYGLVQFFPIIAIPLMLSLYKSPFNYLKEIIVIFLFFALARVAEIFDKEIYYMLGKSISGHSLKHLFMAVSCYRIVVLISHRATSNGKLM